MYKNKILLFGALLAGIFTACTNDAEQPLGAQSLQVDVKTAQANTKALVETSYLPSGSQIGLTVLDANGTNYSGVTYQNVAFTASGSDASQTWSGASAINLFLTEGTLYAYYPYSSSVSNITSVPVNVTTGNDYMYGTPVTGLSATSVDASIALNHALAAIRVNTILGDYTGTGAVTSVRIELGTAQYTTATMNGKTGALSSSSGSVTERSQTVSYTMSASGTATDFLMLPQSTAFDMDIYVTIDGDDYIYSATGVTLAQGSINTYSLTLNSTSSVDLVTRSQADKQGTTTWTTSVEQW